ncbi:MAG: hypothetical protein M1356_02650, partial [Gammaproteobacteria bacterium]|nr:hypothetical protein [Gammaproteobacteria bacterium]
IGFFGTYLSSKLRKTRMTRLHWGSREAVTAGVTNHCFLCSFSATIAPQSAIFPELTFPNRELVNDCATD